MSRAEQSLAVRSLGDIAASLPGSTAIFRRHKLDFCCGGSESLEKAARRKGLDPASIEAELARLSPEQDSIPDSVEDLVGYIVERYHQVHRQEMPELRKLAIRVERVHADHPAAPAGLADLLARMQAELESHMEKEEQVLFPLMLAGGNPMIVHPIGMMRHEHEEHGEQLKALAALTGDMTPPDGACNSWRALYAGLAKLAEDLTEHIHIENNILFPRFEA
ncbi:MAG: iron-sulfur cluster repair protein YtfE [Roseiarcus sp.]|jgi:regulator of cell morphogenesis and NO signaling